MHCMAHAANVKGPRAAIATNPAAWTNSRLWLNAEQRSEMQPRSTWLALRAPFLTQVCRTSWEERDAERVRSR